MMTLEEAIERDNVDDLHKLIVADQKLLDRRSEDPFPNTPLHVAAAAGKTQVALEMAILKPSLASMLNPEGYSPMHLALQHEHYHTVRALMTLDPKLIRVRGRCGITPLHYVAGKEGDDELKLLDEFLRTCQSSIEDLTSRCETVVHVAIKNHNLKASKILFRWLKQIKRVEILNWRDEDGNTVFDIAEYKTPLEEQLEVINLLLTSNKDMDVAERFRLRSYLERYFPESFSRKPGFFEMCALYVFKSCENLFSVQNEATRETILIVSTLIVAATYQATLTPPGGYWQESSSNPKVNSSSSSIALGKPHQAGDIILSDWRLYLYFICNSMAFFSSIATILAATLPLEATSIVYISIPFLCTAYFISLSIQIPIPNAAAAISIGVLFEFSLLAALFLLLYMKIKAQRNSMRDDDTARRVPIS